MKDDKHTSETLSGGPKQGRGNTQHRSEAATGGRDSSGLTNSGSSVGRMSTGSRAASLDRQRGARTGEDEQANAQIENPTRTAGESGSHVMNSAVSGRDAAKDTTTGPGEARSINPEPERKGNIFDPEHPEPDSDTMK